jgi:hypothetical protein
MLPKHAADPALRQSQLDSNVVDAGAAAGGAQKFPRAASARIILSRVRSRRDRIRLQLANPPAPPASPQAATAPDPPQAATPPDPPTPLDVAAWQLLPLLEAAGERWAHVAAPPNAHRP